MPENNLDKLNIGELWIFIVAIVSGAIGGCTAAFTNRSNEKKLITLLSILGYCVTGVFGALVVFTFMSTMGGAEFKNIETVILWSCISGFTTSIGLAGTNLGFRIILKKLGIELEIKVKRVKKKK